jgi:RNA polymerase sigma factor (sigma-70 family)
LNESELVQGLRQRNPAAVQYLSDCYLPSVWRFVYLRVGGDRHLAEDIMSETVLALIRTAAAPDAVIGNVEGWLRSVAGNKVADHFRAAARVQHLIEQATPTLPVADHNDPAVRQEQAEQCAEVRRVMDALPPRHRLVLEWKYLDKLSVREIGRRMQMTEKAAESILFRARREFRDRLQHGVAEESDESEEQSDGVRHNGHCCRQVQQPPAERGQDRNSSGKEARIPVSTPDDTANS